MLVIGIRNIIGNRGIGGPIVESNFLLWKILSVNKMLVKTGSNDKLVWKL